MNLLRKYWKTILVTVVLTFFLLSLYPLITEKPLGDGDDRHNALMGLNLSQSGVISLNGENDVEPDPTNYREPVPAFAVATATQIYKIFTAVEIGPEEYNEGGNPRILKMTNLFWGILCLAAVWLVTHQITKSFYLGLFATLATYYMFVSESIVIDTLYSELQAAALIMLASWTLLVSLKTAKAPYFALTGVFIGLLSLTKAPFFYIFIALFLLFAGIVVYSHQYKLMKKMGLLLFAFIITVSPWMIRNYSHFQKFEITQRGGVILLIRANYDLMSPEEVKGSIFYWASGWIRQNFVKKLWRFSSKDFELGGSMQRLNRDILEINKEAERSGKPEDAISYYHQARAERIRWRNYYLDNGVENPEHLADLALQQEALEIIKTNPIRHIFMTIPFAWRGIWYLSFNQIPREWSDALNFVLFVVFVMGMPFLLWHSRDPKWLAFIVLPMAMLAFYAFFSHNIVRYSRPAYPSEIVSVFLLGHYLLKSIMSSRQTKSIDQKPSNAY